MLGCGETDLVKIVAPIAAYSILEFWLGKTKKVKSSSTIELVITGISLVVIMILRRKDKDGPK